ncbi:MAG: hypothetical protein FWH04_06095 [Oscillospiraceae bacterium]|nr:hypothetical protein [Oscillospiraceae bacterium]
MRMKKIVSLALALIMVLCMLPMMGVMADGPAEPRSGVQDNGEAESFDVSVKAKNDSYAHIDLLTEEIHWATYPRESFSSSPSIREYSTDGGSKWNDIKAGFSSYGSYISETLGSRWVEMDRFFKEKKGMNLSLRIGSVFTTAKTIHYPIIEPRPKKNIEKLKAVLKDGKWQFVTANGEVPKENYLYRYAADGSSAIRILTPEGLEPSRLKAAVTLRSMAKIENGKNIPNSDWFTIILDPVQGASLPAFSDEPDPGPNEDIIVPLGDSDGQINLTTQKITLPQGFVVTEYSAISWRNIDKCEKPPKLWKGTPEKFDKLMHKNVFTKDLAVFDIWGGYEINLPSAMPRKVKKPALFSDGDRLRLSSQKKAFAEYENTEYVEYAYSSNGKTADGSWYNIPANGIPRQAGRTLLIRPRAMQGSKGIHGSGKIMKFKVK